MRETRFSNEIEATLVAEQEALKRFDGRGDAAAAAQINYWGLKHVRNLKIKETEEHVGRTLVDY